SHTKRYHDHQERHSFPTRRSSDLTKSRAGMGSARSRSGRLTWQYGTRSRRSRGSRCSACWLSATDARRIPASSSTPRAATTILRSEEHTSELQSPYDLVCRLLLEK